LTAQGVVDGVKANPMQGVMLAMMLSRMF